jgi:transposase
VANQVKASGQMDNTPQAIGAFLQVLRKKHQVAISQSVFCREHTGIYNAHLLTVLQQAKAAIWLEDATHIKWSGGLQPQRRTGGKNDQIDAQRIAQFAYKNREEVKLWTPARAVIEQLAALASLRQRLIGAKMQLQTPLQEADGLVDPAIQKKLGQHCQKTLTALEKDLAQVEASIQALIDADEHLNQLLRKITSVPGIGKVTATEMIITTNEFKDFSSAKQYACYGGIVPFEHTSGSSIPGKSRLSQKANKAIKKLLHLAAMSAIRVKGKFRDYYLRKVAEGKNKMSVLNAIRNKLVHVVFALVQKQQKYDENYSIAIA